MLRVYVIREKIYRGKKGLLLVGKDSHGRTLDLFGDAEFIVTILRQRYNMPEDDYLRALRNALDSTYPHDDSKPYPQTQAERGQDDQYRGMAEYWATRQGTQGQRREYLLL